jgi:type IV secretory pathway VirD2 relaxase
MTDHEFKPKLGRIRGGSRSKALPYASDVLDQLDKSAGRPLRPTSNRLRHGQQRGLASGALAASGLVAPGSRRAIVKARYTKLDGAPAHLRYILRDGITPDGQPGRLYNEGGEHADGMAFLARSDGDPHQFRFIISPEDSDRLPELKPMIRDLMRQMEEDLGVKLDWVAVDHFNTGHPHTHVVLRGRDKSGQDLILARQYISHGIRSRVQELVTLELGPETDLERLRKLVNEVGQERLTRLDRSLLAQAKDNVLAITAYHEQDPSRHTMRMGRLKTLERLGLAEERQRGIWVLDAMLEGKLRKLGDRADKLKMMQRALDAAGIERQPGMLAVFERGDRKVPVVGRVVGVGLVDEITDRQYVVVDGADGRVHYAELGRRSADAAPQCGMIVKLAADRLEGRPQASSRIEVLSPANLHGQETYLGPTWLDEFISGKERMPRLSTGFGSEVERALATRVRWLTERQLAVRSAEGQVSLKPDALATLRRHETERLARDLARHYGVPFAPAIPGVSFSGVYDRAITTPTAKLAIIRTDTSVTVAPWRPALEPMRGQRVQGVMHQTRVVWTVERGRGLVRPR